MAQADLKGKQALLAEAENAVKECVVRAPVDGTPLLIRVNVGETVGNDPRMPAIQFVANRPLLVRAEVGQEFVGHVREDQSVVIEDHVTGQECAHGRVRSLASWYAPRRTATPEMFQMNSDSPTVECIIQIESKTQQIRIGQRVRVRFPN
jgi:multidrug resistance efflux pump